MEDLHSASRARNWRLSCRTCTLHKELHTSLNTSSAASLGKKYMLPWMSPGRPWQKYTHLFRNLANSPSGEELRTPCKTFNKMLHTGPKASTRRKCRLPCRTLTKHRENRKKLPWEHLIGCQGVKLFLLKYVTITTVSNATVTTDIITTVTIWVLKFCHN